MSAAGATTAIHAQVAAARAGTEPRVLARLRSGWALFGPRQFVRGYLLLLPDPVVPDLNSLGVRARSAWLADMAHLGDALLAVTDAVRINYAIFGNQEPALHAHVIPRYAHEPAALRREQPWAYDWGAAPPFAAAALGPLALALRRSLARRGVSLTSAAVPVPPRRSRRASR